MSEFETVVPSSELIGKTISVRWPDNGEMYEALVVGCRNSEYNYLQHKVFYVADGTLEVLDLSLRDWIYVDRVFRTDGNLGRRVAIWWDAVYEGEPEDAPTQRIPFEAFIVKYIENGTYRLFYPDSDVIEDRHLMKSDLEWSFCDPKVWYVDGCVLASWSNVRS